MNGSLFVTVVSDMWAAWRQSTGDTAIEVRHIILDDHFWADVKFVVDFFEPINDVIHFVDSDSPSLGGNK